MDEWDFFKSRTLMKLKTINKIPGSHRKDRVKKQRKKANML